MAKSLILDQIIAKGQPGYPQGLNEDQIFEFYCIDTLMVNFDLDADEIQNGIVDGPRDAGIDAAYVLVDGNLYSDEMGVEKLRDYFDLQLFLIQAKNEPSFKEAAIDRMATSLPMLLAQDGKKAKLSKIFNSKIVEVCQNFIKTAISGATKFPNCSIKIYYSCKGISPNETVKAKAKHLEQAISQIWKNTSLEILGAEELITHSGKKNITIEIPFNDAPLFGDNYYVLFCNIISYASALSDESGNLIPRLFEANVRAYQGQNDVNREISESLRKPIKNLDFWWLNNGVTMLADEINNVQKKLHIKNPLIVNGLQTSYEIHSYAASKPKKEIRSILLKIIVENDTKKRDQIIRATNKQTSISSQYFLANEPLQTEIELMLEAKDIYYDRKKNEKRRAGRPANKIISIGRLAQAVLAAILFEPHTARARPTLALKSEKKNEIFCEDKTKQPLECYVIVTRLLWSVEQFFKKSLKEEDRLYLNNLKFHVLMVLVWELSSSKKLPAKGVAKLKLSKLTDHDLEKSYKWVKEEFIKFKPTDKTAKDSKFTDRLIQAWQPKKK